MNSFNLAKVFSDNMVLQRRNAIKIWGEAKDDDTKITLSLNNQKATANPVEGKWMVVFPPMEATQCCKMIVTSSNKDDEPIVIDNIAIGEVWIAGGQSNMEFSLKYDFEAEKSIAESNNPFIRFFDVPEVSYECQKNDEDFSEYGLWRLCDPENSEYFSAIAFYFAQKIYESQQVPVGIIGCNWGGTTASTWLREDYLANDEDLHCYLNEYKEATKDLNLAIYEEKFKQSRAMMKSEKFKKIGDALLRETLTQEEIKTIFSNMNPSDSMPVIGPKSENRPSGLYHTMVEKIAGYSARGVIWYQGESDDVKAQIYAKLFSAVIKCWRDAWQDELPFLFVQLAPFGSWLSCNGNNFTILRQQQEIVSKTIPQAYMACIMDVGMEFDIHPKKKRPVGERLALLARGKVYGEDILCDAPEVDSCILEGKTIKIKFNHVGYGFVLKGEKINGLQVFVNGEEINEFTADIQGSMIYINSSNEFKKSNIEIRFAWMGYVEVNLYNSAGIPAKPFLLTL